MKGRGEQGTSCQGTHLGCPLSPVPRFPNATLWRPSLPKLNVFSWGHLPAPQDPVLAWPRAGLWLPGRRKRLHHPHRRPWTPKSQICPPCTALRGCSCSVQRPDPAKGTDKPSLPQNPAQPGLNPHYRGLNLPRAEQEIQFLSWTPRLGFEGTSAASGLHHTPEPGDTSLQSPEWKVRGPVQPWRGTDHQSSPSTPWTDRDHEGSGAGGGFGGTQRSPAPHEVLRHLCLKPCPSPAHHGLTTAQHPQPLCPEQAAIMENKLVNLGTFQALHPSRTPDC